MSHELTHPLTGESLSLTDIPTDTLALTIRQDLDDLAQRVRDAQQAVTDEVARRLDKTGSRTGVLELSDGSRLKLTTNSPTETRYAFDRVKEVIDRLVEEGLLDVAARERVLSYPPPKPQEPRVDRRGINALLKVPSVRRALEEVAVEMESRRTLKVEEL